MAESVRAVLGTVAMVTLLWLAYLTWLMSHRLPLPVASTGFTSDTRSDDESDSARLVIHPVPGVNFSLRDMKCTYHTCFDVDACRLVAEHRIGVYLYPRRRYYTPGGHRLFKVRSRQFDSLMRAIRQSPYYTADPDRACVFLPDIDTLNPHSYELDWLPQYLYQLPRWSSTGANHLLLEAFPVRVALIRPGATIIRLPLARAMVASASFTERTYRSTFDIALPTLAAGRPDDEAELLGDDSLDSTERPVLLASAPPSAPGPLKRLRRRLGDRRFLLLNFCPPATPAASMSAAESRCSANRTRFAYPDVLSKATFCLVFYTQTTGSAGLLDAVSRQCIPVILTNTNIFPLHELIEWNRFSIRLNREADLGSLPRMLTKFSRQYVAFMRYQMRVIYRRYFASPASVAMAVLQVLNDRVFPYMAPSMQESNGPLAGSPVSPPPPLFHTAPLNANQGYTAVVLTRGNRFSALCRTLASLVSGSSSGKMGSPTHLRKIIVVWNGLVEAPPPLGSQWPAMPPSVTLEIIRNRDDRITNRFLPYDEIETDAVFSLFDEDVDVLLPGELLLAYHVWLENPDSVVSLSADSSTDQLSMVLAGAAFYHKQYGAIFHDTLPTELIDFIDTINDCEHVAMNCLVANFTGRSAVKAGPRLGESSRSRSTRPDCLAEVKRHFGSDLLSLRTVTFRADPVLYKTAYANWTANADFRGFNGVT